MSEFSGLVDSHFHSLSMRTKGLDPHECLERFFSQGGRWALDVAVGIAGWQLRQELALAFKGVYLTAGFHPSEAPGVSEGDWETLQGQLANPKTLALGEVGLDWYRGRDSAGVQREVFRRQVGLALKANLPLVIHNREADTELIQDLDAERWSGKGILHCFSSDLSMARRGLDRGFLLSFAGNVTYPSAAALREVARWVPSDQILVETDSPYLSPQGFRSQPNEPLLAGHTAAFIAELRGVNLADFLEQTGRNFARLLGPKLTDPEL
ncbi:MAG: TatD family hydrolase [Spirochaetales bacterium]